MKSKLSVSRSGS